MNERELMIANHKKHLLEQQEKELKAYSQTIENFLEYCKKKKINISKENISYESKIGIVATFPNIVSLLNPKVVIDKEELVDFKLLRDEYKVEPIFSGHFIADNYMIMAHPYFRRGHHPLNNFSPRFLDVFWPFSNDSDKYVSLDFDRVRINVDNRKVMEFDTWFGASFTQEIENVDDGTIKLRPPLDLDDFDIDFFFDSTYSLDIKWYSYDNIKVFQLEEFKTIDRKIIKNKSEYYPVKYIHAEYDIEAKSFRHFDGAIHFYTKDEYLSRRDQDLNYNSKNKLQLKTLSQKLFKLNGEIKVENWIELVSHYLSGNPLIFEYFEGKLPLHIIELLEKIRK